MTSVSVVNEQNNNKFHNFAIGATGAIVGYEAEPYIGNVLYKSIKKVLPSDFKSVRGGDFDKYIQKVIEQNDLKNGFQVLNLNKNTAEELRKKFKLNKKPKFSNLQKIIFHIMRKSPERFERTFNSTLEGYQAFCLPNMNLVVCNLDKFGASVFHEIAHKLNSQSKNIIVKALSKSRNHIAGLGTVVVSMVAMLTDPKNKRKDPEKNLDKVDNFIKDNCGLCATAMVLPKTIEEFIANSKGTKIAKKAGVSGELLNKVKKTHNISRISYAIGAVVTGLSVFLASKLRDYICSYKKETI